MACWLSHNLLEVGSNIISDRVPVLTKGGGVGEKGRIL